MFFNRFYPKSNWSTKHFSFGLNLELQGRLKVRGSEINYLHYIKVAIIKNHGFIIPVLKVSVINPRGFLDLSNFYLIKLISEPLTLRLLWCSRLRPNKKSLADQLPLGQNLLKNDLGWNFFLIWRPLFLRVLERLIKLLTNKHHIYSLKVPDSAILQALFFVYNPGANPNSGNNGTHLAPRSL